MKAMWQHQSIETQQLSASWSLKKGRTKERRRLGRKESYGYETLKVKTLMTKLYGGR
jgi:hypothetical protein